MLAENGYGVKIDVSSAGVILYILLCGFPPFVTENDNQQALLEDMLSCKYGFPELYLDNVSEEAKDLVSSMLQSNPSLRFSAEDVIRSLVVRRQRFVTNKLRSIKKIFSGINPLCVSHVGRVVPDQISFQ